MQRPWGQECPTSCRNSTRSVWPNSGQGSGEAAGPRGLAERMVCPGPQTKLDGITSRLPLLASCTRMSWVYIQQGGPDGRRCRPACEDGRGAVLAPPSQTWLREPCASPVQRSALLGGAGPPGAAERGASVGSLRPAAASAKPRDSRPRNRPRPGLHCAPARTAAPGHCPQRTPRGVKWEPGGGP